MLTRLAYRALFNLLRFVALRSPSAASSHPCTLASPQEPSR